MIYVSMFFVFATYTDTPLAHGIDKAPPDAPQFEGFDIVALFLDLKKLGLMIYEWSPCKFKSRSPSAECNS